MHGVGLNSPTEPSDPEGFITLRCIIVIDVFLLNPIACVHKDDLRPAGKIKLYSVDAV